MAAQDIKKKFQQQINILQKAKKEDLKKQEKMQLVEENKESETKEMLEEFNGRKKASLNQIKDKYNALSTKTNIDSGAL